MRILLVHPNSKIRSTCMPLGLGYIADAVRKAGHEVSMLDARLARLSPDAIVARVRENAPDVVGLSGFFFEKQGVIDVANALKRERGSFSVVLGGPLVSTSGKELVEQGIVDAAVRGEGEVTFNLYLEALERDGDVSGIPGLIYRSHSDEVNFNHITNFVENIDDLNIAWDIVNPEQYYGMFSRSRMGVLKAFERGATILTSRGCPYGCIFCHNIFGNKFRSRSPESVLAEISMFNKEYRISELEIVDDCFNLDLQRAKEIARGIIDLKLGLSISFPNGLRADRMDEELIDLLKEAGTYRINYAIETSIPRLQKLIHKNLDLDHTQEIISYTAAKGICTFGFFMLGFPTETEEEMRATIDYSLRSKFHVAYFHYVTPFPGTALADQFLGNGLRSADFLDLAYYHFSVNLSEVTDQTLRQIRKEAYRRFYLSLNRIWRTFRVIPINWRTAWRLVVRSLTGQ